MEYPLINPPDGKPFHKMTKREAAVYFEWFVREIPIRLSILERVIQSNNDPQFSRWYADKTETSLLLLGAWFMTQVGTQLPSAEFLEFRATHKHPHIPLPDIKEIPSDKTMSLTIDIGMYLGEVFLKHFKNTHWMLLREKSNLDYNQPVIGGIYNVAHNVIVHCNPRQISHVIALSFIDETRTTNALFDTYKFWSKDADLNMNHS